MKKLLLVLPVVALCGCASASKIASTTLSVAQLVGPSLVIAGAEAVGSLTSTNFTKGTLSAQVAIVENDFATLGPTFVADFKTIGGVLKPSPSTNTPPVATRPVPLKPIGFYGTSLNSASN